MIDESRMSHVALRFRHISRQLHPTRVNALSSPYPADHNANLCRVQVADAEDLSAFANDTFDAVTCSSAIMLFPDHNRSARQHLCSRAGALLT